jgi:peptidoglycan/xylan/chitin deacetylase (PgdA/CDA1 family)
LYDLDRALVNGAPLPAKPVILTFDDGYREHYDFVFPRLRDYGMTGTFFIITDPVESGNPRYVTWGQLQEMAAAGMSIEPHTKTHLDLRNRDYDFLVWEVLGSLQTLQGQLNVPAAMFAYPAGRYDDFTLQILDTMPIQRAVTTQHGVTHTTDNGLELTRLRVNGDLGVSGLVYLLNSAG